MTNEEMERAIQFIVQQQAQFTSDLQQMKEAQAQDRAQAKIQFEKLSDAVLSLTGFFGQLVTAETTLAKAQTNLVDAQIRTDSSVAELSERIKELAQRGAETEGRLSTLITVVERLSSEGRNGNRNKKRKRR